MLASVCPANTKLTATNPAIIAVFTLCLLLLLTLPHPQPPSPLIKPVHLLMPRAVMLACLVQRHPIPRTSAGLLLFQVIPLRRRKLSWHTCFLSPSCGTLKNGRVFKGLPLTSFASRTKPSTMPTRNLCPTSKGTALTS